jgi:hypothetical protein
MANQVTAPLTAPIPLASFGMQVNASSEKRSAKYRHVGDDEHPIS